MKPGFAARWRADREGLTAVAVLAVLLVLPLFVPSWQLLQLSKFFSYMLLAASLAWVWGHCGLLCLGQGVFFGVGAYGMSVVTLGKLPFMPWLVSSWAGLALGIGLAVLLALLLGGLFFYARGLGGAFFGIVTLAVAVIAERVTINWDWLGGLNGLMNVPALRAGLNGGEEILDEAQGYYIALVVLTVGVVALLQVIRSTWGRTLLAIRNHETRAQALGIDISKTKTLAFALGAVVAALAGAMFVTQFNFASPPLIGFAMSAEVLIWVALGGRASVVSAALGALLIRLAESWLSEPLGDFWLLVLGGCFLLSVILAPAGVFGFVSRRPSPGAGPG
jgi:ABC-type branched-subunit amino acid transport system permease subunit